MRCAVGASISVKLICWPWAVFMVAVVLMMEIPLHTRLSHTFGAAIY
jgi:hypothetical protein